MTWREYPLKHLAAEPIRNGVGEPAAHEDRNWPRYIRTTDIEGPRSLRPETFKSLPPPFLSEAEVKSGDLLMSAAGSVGKSLLYMEDRPAVYAGYLVRFRPVDWVDCRFIAYWTETPGFLDQIEAGKVRSTIDNFSSTKYQNLRVNLPDSPTQRAIADYLDRETARLDALIGRKSHLIELLDERCEEAVSNVILAQPADAERHWPTDVPLDQEVPDEWSVAPLGRELVYISYGFTNPMPTAEDGPYMLTANDVHDGLVAFESARRTTEEAFGSLLTHKSRPRIGDILLTKDGTLGRVAVLERVRCCINQSVALLRVRPDGPPSRLVAELLRARPYRQALLFDAGGTTIKHLYISRVPKLRIAWPPPSKWRAVLDEIDAVRSSHAAVRRSVARQIDLLLEHRRALITAAVTGELEVSGGAA